MSSRAHVQSSLDNISPTFPGLNASVFEKPDLTESILFLRQHTTVNEEDNAHIVESPSSYTTKVRARALPIDLGIAA